MARYRVFAVADPKDNRVRFVGTTSNPEARLRSLISEARHGTDPNAKDVWLREMLAAGRQPRLILPGIEYDDKTLARDIPEKMAIDIYLAEGHPILNGVGNRKKGPAGDAELRAAVADIIKSEPKLSQAKIAARLRDVMGFQTVSGRAISNSHVAHLKKIITKP